MAALNLPHPYLLFLGDVPHPALAKTAFGLRDWAGDRCLGEYALPQAAVSTGLPRMTPAQARAAGARAMVIGAALPGGQLPASWISSLEEALEAGLDLISGLHEPLARIDRLQRLAARLGRCLIDVRTPPAGLPIGHGRKRSGKRLLTVGTDCTLGKKYAALAIARGLRARGIHADFRATGQTGIMIAGAGMPMDAVVADFLSGAAEVLSPDAAADHWDVIEGQGSLSHPSYAGISLGLLHGSQPDVIVACHKPSRQHLLGLPDFPAPTIRETITVNLLHGRRLNPEVRCGGVALNTAGLSEDEAHALVGQVGGDLGLACADPVRGGPAFERLLDSCLSSSA